ncbi:glycosyltransferase family 4 protein [Corynebacterium glucuronolyticum]|uniref:glycosyltransferase family 4 protein n=1 Tax=Corynebacterium glucuronolyticum TaxID=39791 RepID=UPI00019C22D3|nr:glycosyltransferase family 4 protein [Corynebacterium glucuronolyticum]EEI26167.1 glycosyltransferase, group 1 family protein [Corynebacterium glucuronolyticum ATCC 51867]QRO82365.1 glycosyltransferase family 4 protein [Corynebacterium glucuronolyticum]
MKILLLCWRDTDHPQGGGSERYLEHVGAYLAARGHSVTYFSARAKGMPAHSTKKGVKHIRHGGKMTVYIAGLLHTATHHYDAVVDTQNGIPFFARLTHPRSTVLLTHHCHREQWPVAGPLLGRLGWFLESRVAPRVYRGAPYVTVSEPSKSELLRLGVRGIEIIRNGAPAVPAVSNNHSDRLVTLSRLVPHKRIEHVLDYLAARPDARLDVIGSGWWDANLRAYARELGVESQVIFHGQVSEARKNELLSRAGIHVLPSVKEGWGLAVIEAALHSVPTVGYRTSGGLTDSVRHGRTGVLVDDKAHLFSALDELRTNQEKREELGRNAREFASQFSWEATGEAWEALLQRITTD